MCWTSLRLRPDGLLLWVLRELADVIVKSLDYLWLSQIVIMTGRGFWRLREQIALQSSKEGRNECLGNCKLISLTSITWKAMDKIFPEGVFKHMKVIEHSQHGFTESKSCLTNLIAFYREMTVSVDEEKAVDVFILTLTRFLMLSLISSSLTIWWSMR